MTRMKAIGHPFKYLYDAGVKDFFGLTSITCHADSYAKLSQGFLAYMSTSRIIETIEKEDSEDTLYPLHYVDSGNDLTAIASQYSISSEKVLFEKLSLIADKARSSDHCKGVLIYRDLINSDLQARLNRKLRMFSLAENLVVVQFIKVPYKDRTNLNVLQESDIMLNITDNCVFEVKKNRRAL